MSFDDLFGLLLFVVFIALPALSRMAGSKKPGGGASPGQGAPPPGAPSQGAPTQGRAATASTARPPGPAAGPGPATAAGGGDELERRLAEARERVRRALEGPSGPASAPAQTQVPARPTPRPPTSARQAPVRRSGAFVSSDRDDGKLSTPLDPAAVGTLGRERAAARGAPARFTEAPALQVERPGARTGPRAARATATFATDPETIRSAIIWHQVLGEPRARRPLGGRPSTLRSR